MYLVNDPRLSLVSSRNRRLMARKLQNILVTAGTSEMFQNVEADIIGARLITQVVRRSIFNSRLVLQFSLFRVPWVDTDLQ